MSKAIIPSVRRLYQSDLKENGYGSRSTVWRKRRRKLIPEPIIDECGRPYWTEGILLRHQKELIRRQAKTGA